MDSYEEPKKEDQIIADKEEKKNIEWTMEMIEAKLLASLNLDEEAGNEKIDNGKFEVCYSLDIVTLKIIAFLCN